MGHALAMNVDQPLGNAYELSKLSNPAYERDVKSEISNENHTSGNRSATGFSFTNSLMFPFAIQSETIANCASVIITPTSGRIFGWSSVLHVTTSLQNFYIGLGQKVDTGPEGNRQLTPIIFCKSLVEYVLRTFTATSRPQCSPFHTSANPPLYSA